MMTKTSYVDLHHIVVFHDSALKECPSIAPRFLDDEQFVLRDAGLQARVLQRFLLTIGSMVFFSPAILIHGLSFMHKMLQDSESEGNMNRAD